MRTTILFLLMTAVCAAGEFGEIRLGKPAPVPRQPEPIITDRFGGGVGAGGAYSRTAGGLIGPGGFMMEAGGGYIDSQGQFRPRIGPPPTGFRGENTDKPFRTKRR
jgi:hypothetical protein